MAEQSAVLYLTHKLATYTAFRVIHRVQASGSVLRLQRNKVTVVYNGVVEGVPRFTKQRVLRVVA